jgi:phosphoenolpyruvate-protein phosphotransferase
VSEIDLVSPLRGWLAPLEEVPDPVFADRMLGDGAAIDPTGDTLHAPCAGVVIGLHHTRHAVTLRADNGAEILMHIGLETVALGGEGFTVHVGEGQRVAAGDWLVSFDLDRLARRAKSLITPMVITNGEAFEIVRREQGREVEVGEAIMTLRAIGAAIAVAEVAGARVERAVRVPLAHGIHARPAATISARAKLFAAEVSLSANGRSANARSPVALMALGVRCYDDVSISASGPDAERAIEAIANLILVEIDEPADAVAPTRPAGTPPAPDVAAETPGRLKGVTAAPGLVIGIAARLLAAEITVATASRGGEIEAAALSDALAQVRTRIEIQMAAAPKAQRAILGAHLAFLEDPELVQAARDLIGQNLSAGLAWKQAIGGYIALVRGAGDPRIAERVDDLVDLERQVLLTLSGETASAAPLPKGAILLADDLLPSQLMDLDASRLAGLCTAGGGPTSHVAILAASMNVPALVAAGPGVMNIADGATLILDADAGTLQIGPDQHALAQAQTAVAANQNRRQAARARAHEDCRTADGVRIEVMANLASLADANAAVAAGAEGCGLLRTEFLFLHRDSAPDEDEQATAYGAIAEALGERPLVIRTLDVGGDKAVDYLPIPPEENPALGLRGLRVSLWRPELLRDQLRAILRSAHANTRIMIPMVASLHEFNAVRAVVDEARAELGDAPAVKLGAMVETPAAAMTTDLLCAEAEFISIGTNDLAQYTLAMDRGNPAVAAEVDGLHPAVLRMIARAVDGAKLHGRPVSVCGGLASDLTAAPILLGLGVTSLSASPAITPELKALIRTLTLPDCAALAAEALAQPSAAAVRALSAARMAGKPSLGRGAA